MTSAQTQQDRIPVGVDDGHYAIKVTRLVDNELVCTSIRSQAWQGRQTTTQFGLEETNSSEDVIYEVANDEYVTVNANSVLSKSMDTRSDDYPTSSLNRALVVHALCNAGLAGQQVGVVTGLPIDRFFNEGIPNNQLIEAKRQSLLRPIRRMGQDDVAIHIGEHKVLSEAVAAYFDAAYDHLGNVNQGFKEISDYDPVAVVDVGGKTTDIAVVKEGGKGLYAQYSDTAEIGALNLRDELNSMVRKRFNLENPVSETHIDRLIATGTYRLYGQAHDLSEEVSNQIDEFAERIGFEVNRLIGAAESMGSIIFVGGGAELLKTRTNIVFPKLPQSAITIHDNPAFANSRGMFKAALLVSRIAG